MKYGNEEVKNWYEHQPNNICIIYTQVPLIMVHLKIPTVNILKTLLLARCKEAFMGFPCYYLLIDCNKAS